VAVFPTTTPPSALTAPVVFTWVPIATPLTSTENVHEAFDAKVAPDKLILPLPATAVIVPPPQVPCTLLGVATLRPDGSVSVNATVPSAVAAFWLLIVKLSAVVFRPNNWISESANALLMDGGSTTVRVAVAMPPGPLSVDVTALVLLTFVPTVVPVTFTLKVQVPLGASDAPDKLTVFDPATAVIVPPPQLPVNPLGVLTITPAGKVSENPIPVKVVFVVAPVLGFEIVKESDDVPPTWILGVPKLFVIVGAAGTTGVSNTKSSKFSIPPPGQPAFAT